MRVAFIILLAATLLSCQHKKHIPLIYTKVSDTLPVDASFSLFQYHQQLLYCLNTSSNEINVYDMAQKQLRQKIKIGDTSLNGLSTGKINSFYVHNDDSIFIQYLFCLALTDTSGVLKYGRLMNAPGEKDWPATIYNNFGDVFPMYYDGVMKKIFMKQYSGQQPMWHPGFYKRKVEAALNLKDTLVEELPVGYPAIYQQNYYGEANLVFREVDDSCHIYSFMASPEIVLYNRFTKAVRHIRTEGSDARPIDLKYRKDMDRRVDHLIENPLYMKVLFDKYRNCYYRISLSEKELKNKDGSYNTFSDKELVISVFDKQFQWIDDVNTGSNYLWNFSFVTPQGLYILKNSANTNINQATINAKQFIFDIFTFSAGGRSVM